MTPDEFQKLSKEEQKAFLERIRNPQNLPREESNDDGADTILKTFTPEQVKAHLKDIERFTKW